MLKDKNFASSMIRAVIIHLVKYCTRKLLLGLWSLCKKSLCHPSRKFQPTWTTEIQILNMLLLLLLVKKSIIHPSIHPLCAQKDQIRSKRVPRCLKFKFRTTHKISRILLLKSIVVEIKSPTEWVQKWSKLEFVFV